MREWRNSENVRPYMYTDHIISIEEHSEWFERMMADGTNKYCVIELDKVAVGVVCLTDIDVVNECCSWGFYIFDPNVRGKGVGSFVEKYILKYVFEDLKLQKLSCEVLETNPNVVKMHEKFGFVQEGFFEKAIKKGDQLIGFYRLSILKENYDAP
jgi:UDP-4-amino-4,6-dideoxy-N-acetyl-beta-L-altrosamine N-acetyltransferase